MKSASFIALGASLAITSAIPVEGVEGGMVVQGGNADTRFGMFFKPIKNILETAAGEEKSAAKSANTEDESNDEDTPEVSGSGIIVAEVLPEPSIREEIMIVETIPTAPELVMSGLMNMLSPQRISPPSMVGQESVMEELLEEIRHSEFGGEDNLNLRIEVDFAADRAPGPPSGLPDLLSMLEPMIEPTLPRMNAGEAMMIEII
ncbi:hypothetical protein TWF569_000140 [Orbilia oligospora]|uniref:Uncharacterized protein n=1 Tax=Orbilia oligospora TaxID=2813651 RepID=A0A7C8NG84_ORBOL|nr:hypothetical protein TWF102_003053 [Orbilia oligospora]KAF3109366.1 hypothetical protein TWF103_005240 [Orbilia oligospora]KAF3112239.1 hypothetical protein TWF706_010830 [Orbilia oligospora]KAF3147302.1 hypothetical protein TWF703_000143 [Orbilia oligospora]KAF3150537.1 hypothetical protein TWF594_009180 [Orbilia oligospora]